MESQLHSLQSMQLFSCWCRDNGKQSKHTARLCPATKINTVDGTSCIFSLSLWMDGCACNSLTENDRPCFSPTSWLRFHTQKQTEWWPNKNVRDTGRAQSLLNRISSSKRQEIKLAWQSNFSTESEGVKGVWEVEKKKKSCGAKSDGAAGGGEETEASRRGGGGRGCPWNCLTHYCSSTAMRGDGSLAEWELWAGRWRMESERRECVFF